MNSNALVALLTRSDLNQTCGTYRTVQDGRLWRLIWVEIESTQRGVERHERQVTLAKSEQQAERMARAMLKV